MSGELTFEGAHGTIKFMLQASETTDQLIERMAKYVIRYDVEFKLCTIKKHILDENRQVCSIEELDLTNEVRKQIQSFKGAVQTV